MFQGEPDEIWEPYIPSFTNKRNCPVLCVCPEDSGLPVEAAGGYSGVLKVRALLTVKFGPTHPATAGDSRCRYP